MSSDDPLQRATDLIRQWYYSEIRSIADAAIEACHGRLVTAADAVQWGWFDDVPRGRSRRSAIDSFVEHRIAVRDTGMSAVRYQERESDTDPREFLQEWVDSNTDDHQFVIYTYMAKCALLASDNEDAYASEHGEPAATVGAAACAAMRADVWQLLEARSDEWQCDDPDVADDPDDDRSTHDTEICPCAGCASARAAKPSRHDGSAS